MTDRRVRVDISPDEGVSWHLDALVSQQDASIVDGTVDAPHGDRIYRTVRFHVGGFDVDANAPWDAFIPTPDARPFADVPGRFRVRWQDRTAVVDSITLKAGSAPTSDLLQLPVASGRWVYLSVSGPGRSLAPLMNGPL